MKRIKIVFIFLFIFTTLMAVAGGIGVGVILAGMDNIDVRKYLFDDFKPSLPSQVVDRNGVLITEFIGVEKRDIISVNQLPQHFINALISREDKNFFSHHGFDILAIMRAAYDNFIAGEIVSGASTITQQVAGTYFEDRTDKSYMRKIKELWYAILLEQNLTKQEILGLYINEVYFGHNNYGVEAASQFYFNHSASEVTVAEAAMLVLQLSSPALYSPINNPDVAKDRQYHILLSMAEDGYIGRSVAENSFNDFWQNYDPTRSSDASSNTENSSKAPYFSEYVRLELNNMLFGAVNIYRDGYVIHTTLDLETQKTADEIMAWAYKDINNRYATNAAQKRLLASRQYIPMTQLLGLTFNIPDFLRRSSRAKANAYENFYQRINPINDMMSLLFTMPDLNEISAIGSEHNRKQLEKSVVEGALLALESGTGHILAMVGGSDFELKKYNRAADARVQIGSSIKPLYYSAAISNRAVTPATRIIDKPVIYYTPDNKPYTPDNYMGEWKGSVLTRYALATSMNVPSIDVLDRVGFEPAIDRVSRMLGLEEFSDNETMFPRVYPFALGITAASPLRMAQAYSIFVNQGKLVKPTAIIYVEDRDGNIILQPDQDNIIERQKNPEQYRIMTPQEAYVMVNMMQSTVDFGTLANRRRSVGGFDGMPMAGKTGTTQNWSDAWTVGFSPHIITAVWFGFDIPGNSLGRYLTGATAAGPVWARFMKEINQPLDKIEFARPETGLSVAAVCAVSGLLPTAYCDEGVKSELFVAGSVPAKSCDIHPFEHERDQMVTERLQNLVRDNIAGSIAPPSLIAPPSFSGRQNFNTNFGALSPPPVDNLPPSGGETTNSPAEPVIENFDNSADTSETISEDLLR